MVKTIRTGTKPSKRYPTSPELFRKYLHGLPLDIKKIIHKMSINNHMEIWRLEHVERSKLTNKFIEKHGSPGWNPIRAIVLNYISKFTIRDDVTIKVGGIRYRISVKNSSGRI